MGMCVEEQNLGLMTKRRRRSQTDFLANMTKTVPAVLGLILFKYLM